MRIADRTIGPGQPVFIVAEVSGNHEGNVANAFELIDYAAWAGADAVKFQCWMDPTDMAPASADPRFMLKSGLWAGRTLYDLYREIQTPPQWFGALFEVAEAAGLVPFSSAFSFAAVDHLQKMGCPAYKVASPEVVWLDLIAHMAATGKPIILSTGLATDAEIDAALQFGDDHALLHCVASYPTLPSEMNLRRITTLRGEFGRTVGLSDHSFGPTAAIAAVALGASIIEKHLMLPWPNKSPDKGFAMTPMEFRDMVRAVRETEQALGTGAAPDVTGCRRQEIEGRWVRCVA